jgi:hypothetical protein
VNPRSPQVRAFVRRVHWRLVTLRTLEGAGLGLLGACAVGLVLVSILIYRGEPAIATTLALLCIGAIFGAAWAIYRKPSRLDAAVEADRQLNLADLIATAFLLGEKDPSEPFLGAVILLAEQKAAALSPSSVILNRLGARAWGGIGLAMALVITIGLMSANPVESEASAGDALSPHRLLTSRLKPQTPEIKAGGSTDTASSAMPRKNGDNDERPLDPHQNTKIEMVRNSNPAREGNSVTNPDGTGGGAGRTNVQPKTNDPLPANATNSRTSNGTGTTSSGTGLSGEGPARQGASGHSAGDTGHHPSVPPWQSADWPKARDGAMQALQSGQVPAGYEEMVREYFAK